MKKDVTVTPEEQYLYLPESIQSARESGMLSIHHLMHIMRVMACVGKPYSDLHTSLEELLELVIKGLTRQIHFQERRIKQLQNKSASGTKGYLQAQKRTLAQLYHLRRKYQRRLNKLR